MPPKELLGYPETIKRHVAEDAIPLHGVFVFNTEKQIIFLYKTR